MNAFLPLLQKLARIELQASEVGALGSRLAEVTDWDELLNQAELYGLSSLLLKHTSEHNLPVPQSAMLSLKGLALRHRSAADARYRLMQELSATFAEHQIPLVALKGIVLAPMIYPADGLRPMRDIDILVPADKEALAAALLREIGFDLPATQPSKYMRDTHQLPNATRQVNGFTISVEIHHDAITQNVPEKLSYQDVEESLQTVAWRDLKLTTLGHEQMLHQISRHLEGLHPGAVLKLINVLDVVLYSERFIDEIDWDVIGRRYSHVINTLKCLHMIVPLSAQLQAKAGGVATTRSDDIGEIMLPLTRIIHKQNSWLTQFRLLFKPSDWWLHLYYAVDPDKSLVFVKLVRHPLRVCSWLGSRLYSRMLGG